jgi:uncharacterized protein involved in response to NO
MSTTPANPLSNDPYREPLPIRLFQAGIFLVGLVLIFIDMDPSKLKAGSFPTVIFLSILAGFMGGRVSGRNKKNYNIVAGMIAVVMLANVVYRVMGAAV